MRVKSEGYSLYWVGSELGITHVLSRVILRVRVNKK